MSVTNLETATLLQNLTGVLTKMGYTEYYSSFNPLYMNYILWPQYRDSAPPQLRPALDLFLLGKRVQAADCAGPLRDLFEPLAQLCVLDIQEDTVMTTDLILLPLFGFWLFCQKPQVNPTLYFGDDSIALLLRQRPPLGGTCLDLCSGPGVQAIWANHFASRMTSVEINSFAQAIAKINMCMNGCSDRIEVLCGNLYDPVAGRHFDAIIANPPLLPFPEHIAYPFVGHGGADGLSVTWKILDGLPAHLAPEGHAQIIGTCLSDGLLPLCIERLSAWACAQKMRVLFTITKCVPLRPGIRFFDLLVETAVMSTGEPSERIAHAYAKSLDEQCASHLCFFYLYLSHGEGGIILQDLSLEDQPGGWFLGG